MQTDPLSYHYIEGFVKQCMDAGLNEEQTTTLLDTVQKEYLAEHNEDYKAGMKSAFDKQAAVNPALLKTLGAAAGGSLLGGAALNIAPTNFRDSMHKGTDLNFGYGAGDNHYGTSLPVSGEALGAGLGATLGGLAMLRKGKFRNAFRGAMPFRKATMTNSLGKTNTGWVGDLKKPLQNKGDLGLTAAHLGGGAAAGGGAVMTSKGIANSIDSSRENKLNEARELLLGEGYNISDSFGGGVDNGTPWYSKLTGGGASPAGGNDIPNLSLLPGEVQRQIRGQGDTGQSMLLGPQAAVHSAGNRLSQLEQKMQQVSAAAQNPSLSPADRMSARKAEYALKVERNRALSELRSATNQLRKDQMRMEEAQQTGLQEAGVIGQNLTNRLENYPALPTPRGSFFKGNTPSFDDHAAGKSKLKQQQLENEQRLWELQNMQQPNLITPEMNQIITQHGI